MHIELITFGKSKELNLESAENEYLKRLKGELNLKQTSLPQAKTKISSQAIMLEEAKNLLYYIKPVTHLIILDEYGINLTSKEFAQLLQNYKNQAVSNLTFAIGGPYGWDDSIRKRANYSLSLSKLTFPAHVAKFLLIEQLYRATSILNGHPYHK